MQEWHWFDFLFSCHTLVKKKLDRNYLMTANMFVCLTAIQKKKTEQLWQNKWFFFFSCWLQEIHFHCLLGPNCTAVTNRNTPQKNTDDTVKCVVKMRCELILSLVNFQWNWCGDGMSILCYNCTRFAVWIDQFRQILIQNSQSEFLMGLLYTFAELWVM